MPGENEPAVINTGPLIALSTCDQLELLPRLHLRLIAPQAVLAELERGRASARIAVPRPVWLEVESLSSPPSPLLLAHLDEGEAAVINLALERKLQRVIIDERRGRLVARAMGLAVTGSAGILLRAKKTGILPAVKPCLETMQKRGIWLSERLVEFVLRESGEL